MPPCACGREFIQQVRPILQTGDLEALTFALRAGWPNERLCDLLGSDHPDAVKVALFCLSIMGDMRDCSAIAQVFRHPDDSTANLAEYTLWAIWMRAGSDKVNAALRRAVELISLNQLEDAEACLTGIIAADPQFAEAYNQRSIVRFLRGDYAGAMRDDRLTLRYNPWHFAAMAGLGHCFAAQGQARQALLAYRAAQLLHPRAEGIQQAVADLAVILSEPDDPEARAMTLYLTSAGIQPG